MINKAEELYDIKTTMLTIIENMPAGICLYTGKADIERQQQESSISSQVNYEAFIQAKIDNAKVDETALDPEKKAALKSTRAKTRTELENNVIRQLASHSGETNQTIYDFYIPPYDHDDIPQKFYLTYFTHEPGISPCQLQPNSAFVEKITLPFIVVRLIGIACPTAPALYTVTKFKTGIFGQFYGTRDEGDELTPSSRVPCDYVAHKVKSELPVGREKLELSQLLELIQSTTVDAPVPEIKPVPLVAQPKLQYLLPLEITKQRSFTQKPNQEYGQQIQGSYPYPILKDKESDQLPDTTCQPPTKVFTNSLMEGARKFIGRARPAPPQKASTLDREQQFGATNK